MQVKILRKETNPSKNRSLRRSVHTVGLLIKTYLSPKKTLSSFAQISLLLIFEFKVLIVLIYSTPSNYITLPTSNSSFSFHQILEVLGPTPLFQINRLWSPRYFGCFAFMSFSSLSKSNLGPLRLESTMQMKNIHRIYLYFPRMIVNRSQVSHTVLQ